MHISYALPPSLKTLTVEFEGPDMTSMTSRTERFWGVFDDAIPQYTNLESVRFLTVNITGDENDVMSEHAQERLRRRLPRAAERNLLMFWFLSTRRFAGARGIL
ncbi:unnamed protein product [Somion occarium]|uniref:Uncharacterized protein n=1 Tax=Somion occarium TaxID=3059160 RepID=A0ABP1EB33_9APHY